MNKFNMMKAFALTAVMTVAAISAAQPQGGPQAGPRGGGQGQMGGPGMRGPGVPGGLLILNMKTVQDELKITAEQDKAIDQLTLRVMRNGGGGPGGPGGPGGGFGGPGQGGPGQGGGRGQGGGGQRPPFDGEGDDWSAQQGGGRGQGGRGQGQGQGQGFGGPGQGQGPDFIAALEKILNERQMNRHHQLTLQWEAPMVFMRPEVGRKLEITEEQRGDINEIIRKFMPPPGGGPGGPGGGFGGPGQGGPGQGGGRGQGGRGQGGQRPPFGEDEGSGWFAQQGGGPGQGGFGGGQGGRGQGGPGQGQNFEEMLAKKKKAMTEVMTVFSDGQKRIWAEMVGSKFDKWVAPELPRPQGGPGGPGGNGGPGMPPPPPVDF